MSQTFVKDGNIIDYTNPSSSAAIAVDTVILLPTKLGVALSAIAASGTGSISVAGVHSLPALSTDVWKLGDPLWWDAGNTRLTRLGVAGLRFAGVAAADKASAATRADVHLNDLGNYPADFIDRVQIDSAVDVTWAAATHSGSVIRITADAKTVTLPVGVAGMEAIIQNAAADGAALVTVDLNGNEIIEGGNLTIAATKTALNTKVTARRGDYLHLICNVAATSWRCVKSRGTWASS